MTQVASDEQVEGARKVRAMARCMAESGLNCVGAYTEEDPIGWPWANPAIRQFIQQD